MDTHQKAFSHLKKDKVLKTVMEGVGELKIKKSKDLYFALLKAIVSQQLSVKAADTIWKRFLALFKEGYPHPDKLLKMKNEKLREAGLSFQKAGYLKNIARFTQTHTLEYKKLKNKTDDELIHYLVQIKGVGKWTAEMLLMFNLSRYDIFPKDDLGIQNGIKSLYKTGNVTVKELHEKMELIASAWRPYRSLACLYIWRHKDLVFTTKKQ